MPRTTRSRQPHRQQRRARLQVVEQPRKQRETKAEQFQRIMPRRLATALNAMELLKQPFDRDAYDYTEAQGKRVIRELVLKVYDVQQAFLSGAKIRHRNVLLDDERDLDTLGRDAGLLDDLKDVL